MFHSNAIQHAENTKKAVISDINLQEEKDNTLTDQRDFLHPHHFHHYAQALLDSSYLQPFKQKNFHKNNIRDGFIEREIHGAMHAARVAIYISILHKIIKQNFPVYVKKTIDALSKKFLLNEEKLILLTRYVALGHDSAREDEGYDRWEKESGEIINEFLIKNGVPQETTKLFSLLAQHKDHPEKISNISPDLGYLRCLISLADCFDIIRCTSAFDFSYIDKELQSIDGYHSEQHANIFLEFAKNVLLLLKNQKDIYFPTKIHDINNKIYQLPEGDEDFSVPEKVKLEHSNNVCSVTVKMMREIAYFSDFLNEEILENSDFSSVAPAFNPFIHGTNSQSLALFRQTKYQLLAPTEMIEEYLLAPMTGELTIPSGVYHTYPCFGRLNTTSRYNLQHIVDAYSAVRNGFTLESIQDESLNRLQFILKFNSSRVDWLPFFNSQSDLISGNVNPFDTINEVLIHLARFKQTGGDLSFFHEPLAVYRSRLNASIGLFYLVLFIAHYIAPNKKYYHLLEPIQIKSLFNSIRSELNAENLVKKINILNLDIRKLYEEPTEDNIQIIIKLLSFPACKTSLTSKKRFDAQSDTEKNLMKRGIIGPNILDISYLNHCRIPFVVNEEKESTSNDKYSSFEIESFFSYDKFNIDDILNKFIKNEINSADILQEEKKILEIINVYSSKLNSLDALLNHTSTLILNGQEKEFIERPFPIIFIYDSYQHMRIKTFSTQEYRAQSPLVMQQHITQIATDTIENAEKLDNFFKTEGLDHIDIVLFSQLEKSLQTKIRPKHFLLDEEVCSVKSKYTFSV